MNFSFNYQPDSYNLIPFIDAVLAHALACHASDLHFEIFKDELVIRLRQDGDLSVLTTAPAHLGAAIVSRLKVMAQLDIAEKRLPQDGRFSWQGQANQVVECRLSTCPTLFGEKGVVRLLNSEQKFRHLEELGLEPWQMNCLKTQLAKSQGLILVTGPTGSGKTVTLYAALAALNQSKRNIVTVEDPVEIALPGINQVNVNYKMGLGFTEVMRAFLRQDPDIIMLGEIRDVETAEIALKAAQTGHLVLATLHTNSAAKTLLRLLHLGLPAYLLVSCINLIIAQRLIRRFDSHGESNGRTAIYEFLPMTDALGNIILSAKSLPEIVAYQKARNLPTLREAGMLKVAQGITTEAEIFTVTDET